MNEWLLIFLMALVTYLPRYLPFAFAGKIHLPWTVARGLDFVPVAVLTAIIAQTAIMRVGEADFSVQNFHAISALAAFLAALIWRRLLVTITVGLGVFVLLRAFG